MPPATHSANDEAAFMADLLVDMDDSFWNSAPTPDSSPRKPPSRHLSTPRRPKTRDKPSKSSTLDVPSPSKVFSAEGFDMTELLEGAEDWDWDDTMSDIVTPKKSPRKHKTIIPKATPYVPETCTRCTVESISESEHDKYYQKTLIVKVDPGEERRSVVLREDWTATDIRRGDTINILGTFTLITPSTSSVTSTITITSKSNLLIHHPDVLLTATSLSNAPQCRRKPLLSNLVRSSSDTTPALVWGNMLHEVMQSCLSEGRWEPTFMEEKIDDVILKGLNELIKIDVSIDQAKREVINRAKGLLAFSQRYISDFPKPSAVLTNTRAAHNQGNSLLAISELLDVEEDIWSPVYGIKGKLDATVNTVISDPNPPFTQPILSAGPKPFEIKTGRAIAGMEHRAQTMLYTLLAAERYGVEVPAGLLYYTQSDEVVRVPAGRNEVRGLIVARNEMAGYMMRRNEKSGNEEAAFEPFLPPTIDDERVCKRCYALDTCMLYRKAIENVVDTSSPIADTYELKTSHLTPIQTSFFQKWEALISLEEQDLVRFKKELWTMGAAERENKGRCFSSMTLDTSFRSSSPKTSTTTDNKIHRFTYRFVRIQTNGTTPSLLNGHINIGDAVTVSVEPGLLALARGFIIDLMPTDVVIGVDHKLCTDSIAKRLARGASSSPSSEIVFRIDKDELFGGMGRIRDNLAQLFYADGDIRRLKLVVDLQFPVFDEEPLLLPPALSRFAAHLNTNQQQAMTKVLSAQDYALILGMPGTGKTTVIAAIIKTLVAMGKTVLLTSYTHSAVDTILSKLLDADFSILRLGNIDKIHPDVQKFTLANRRTATTIEQLQHQLMTPPVVATTCLSIDHALFSRRKFDYCIVDEASQITLPTCLGPLRYADKFVLVGDHFQLPPLVRNRAARKGGLDVSLFRRLSDAHPHAVVDLAYQYRMNEDIMLLSNKLIYGDRLRCGSEAIAHRSLVLSDRTFLKTLHSGTSCQANGCWIEVLMSESCKAVFVDTDDIPARDSRVGDLVQNEIEADLVRQITETMLRSGVREEQIGVLSLYRQQVKLLTHLLHARKGIEILTADRSQGRDKDCIIISMVRSNDSGSIGDLVKDWRRMNVSFTRARSKLIIIGSRKTLQGAALLSEFFNLMDSRGWTLRLLPNAHRVHAALSSPPATPNKRPADEIDECIVGKENLVGVGRQLKKVKVTAELGLLRGRPILRDVVNGDV
ncbi:DNA replication ATP-dependent helicase/nuclease dna2 [Hypsizygus marmoreus]|uniref:DNA replication ATP-dependent helicase/nuclease DNA2 n=1 Tax=Hypsizygus marmoreus TaxID=39966 RepID=A0A369K569_HYPMA|nr:DNA replication ATP-dependent helicase/nuclease dna2 [Hypsizygus marmoreus]